MVVDFFTFGWKITVTDMGSFHFNAQFVLPGATYLSNYQDFCVPKRILMNKLGLLSEFKKTQDSPKLSFKSINDPIWITGRRLVRWRLFQVYQAFRNILLSYKK